MIERKEFKGVNCLGRSDECVFSFLGDCRITFKFVSNFAGMLAACQAVILCLFR